MKMRIGSLAVFVAVLMCLTAAPAWAAVWDGSDGLLWSNGNNWTPAGVPDGEDAIINNGLLASPTLNSSVADIINLEVSGFSTLNITGLADLTATGSGNIAGTGFDEGYVNQDGGMVSFGSNLTLADASNDFARWTMTLDGSLAVANNLTVGDSGAAEFDLGGTSTLTVGGQIDVGKGGAGNGVMTVSGGTLGQLAGGGDPAILADLAVNAGGALQVQGSTATINVANYEQASEGSLNLVMDNGGIAPINIDGNMTLTGTLNVSLASGAVPAPGFYDFLVAKGTRTDTFKSVNLPGGMVLRYEEDLDGNQVARLYFGIEFPPPAGAGDVISVNTDWWAEPLAPAGVAGVEPADNWNNVSGGNVVELGLTSTAAETTVVGMRASGAEPGNVEINDGGTLPDYDMMDNGPASLVPFSGGSKEYAQLELTGLTAQYPDGYDVIVYFGTGGNGGTGASNPVGGYTVVTGPNTYSVDTQETPFGFGSVQVPMPPAGPNVASIHGWSDMHNAGVVHNFTNQYVLSADENTPGNYHIVSAQVMDTLTLTFVPEYSGFQSLDSFTLLGFQLRSSAEQPEPMEFIVDNLDYPDYWSLSAGLKTNDVIDGWREYPTGAFAWYGREDTWAQWDAPALPFEEPTEYEVFTWVAATSPGGILRERDPIALYTIKHADGETVFEFDQNTAPGTWVSLGKYFFTNDGLEYVRIDNGSGADGPVTSYDAVRWLWTPPEAPVSAIPEPAGLGLIGLALLGLRKKRR